MGSRSVALSAPSTPEIQALVAAWQWQTGTISRDTLRHNFRTGEILPPARTNEQEMKLIRKDPTPMPVATSPRVNAP